MRRPPRPLLPLVLLVAAVGATAPAAHAETLVVAHDAGAGAGDRAQLRREAGVRHVRDLRVGGLEVVEVPDDRATAALADLRDADGVRWAQADPTAHAFGAVADPYLPLEWGLAAMGAPAAWAVADGRGTTVGVVDTGVDAAHPDLAGQLDPRGAATDPNGHGTHVAGVVAAATSNGIGVAGVAPGARVLALQALGADGSGPMSAVADAEDRAADLGARVINLSLGSDGPSLAERTVIRAHPGVLFVAAAGNQSRDDDARPTYPCAYDEPNVLCVGAEARAGGLASFSNWGARSVDLLAPGEHIASTWTGGAYRYADGTSMAAPFAAAAAAVLLGRDPALRPEQLRAILVGSSRPDPAAAGRVAGGDLDLGRALSAAVPQAAAPAVPSAPAAAAPPPGTTAAAPAAGPTAPALSDVRLRGTLARACRTARRRFASGRGARRTAPRGRCRARTVEVRWRLARRATVGLAFERRACRAGRCRWTVVRRVRASAPAGTAARRLGAAPGGRPLARGRYRLRVAALGATRRTRAFSVVG